MSKRQFKSTKLRIFSRSKLLFINLQSAVVLVTDDNFLVWQRDSIENFNPILSVSKVKANVKNSSLNKSKNLSAVTYPIRSELVQVMERSTGSSNYLSIRLPRPAYIYLLPTDPCQHIENSVTQLPTSHRIFLTMSLFVDKEVYNNTGISLFEGISAIVR